VGFTDIVKRPSANATELRPEEFDYGRDLLVAKIESARPGLALFTFKKTAVVLFGPIPGNGLIPGLELGGAPVFVMPGPYAPGDEVRGKLRELARLTNLEG
jgi:G:T/U-mismatch repair DNA glycosylase